MHITLRPVVVTLLALLTTVVGLPATASAETTARIGYDVSHPQCGQELPEDRAFAVVGVNGGLATHPNPCLAEQLSWAWGSDGSEATQPEAQVYLNTANPGQVLHHVTTWPTAGATPYGECDGSNSMACSWEYGWERASASVLSFFVPAARTAGVASDPDRYVWWLDVETANTWQTGSPDALARNRAALEGMTASITARGGRVGVYSTAQQWAQIVGRVPEGSALAGRPSWLAGSTSLDDARADCSDRGLTPGSAVALTQYVVDGLDRNHACG